MTILRGTILAVFFLMELASLGALGYWGFHLDRSLWVQILAGLGAPLLTAIFWGGVVAPKATFPVSVPVRALLQFLVFALSVAALYASGRTSLAILLGAVVLIEMILTYTLDFNGTPSSFFEERCLKTARCGESNVVCAREPFDSARHSRRLFNLGHASAK
ncbi:YrdB family protein [Cohnella sp. REN36]|uniref:YrdB family protein n=1 Tax=Cohnella sp. REN36 TaxID=2887347 RepID=UPI001D148B06|nr:YrdB family protein [Cohnella sp. REN36]MCC3376826.1 YrdB family protein [Cohnella sp. REN36]